ncbi:MAG: hypothetical protein H6720_04615 [Sandaracinus sp.]|nr:hypothetical protein [Sandaracinus sp.]
MQALRVRGSALSLSLFSCLLLVAYGCGDDDEPPPVDGGMTDGMVLPDGDLPDGFLPDGDRPDGSVTPGDLFPPPTITTCPGDALPAPSEGRCTVTAGNAALLITGDVLTPGEVFRGGQVLVGTDGLIACVGCDCTSATGAGEATQVVCPDSVVSPGLINAHDHLPFGQGLPYSADSVGMLTDERYEHRHDWRRGLDGHTRVSAASNFTTVPQQLWVELRQLMSGTTSVFGQGGPAGLIRNLDNGNRNDLPGTDFAEYQTFPLRDSDGTKRNSDCSYAFCDGQACGFGSPRHLQYVPHVAEGIDEAARNEFRCMREGTNGHRRANSPRSSTALVFCRRTSPK